MASRAACGAAVAGRRELNRLTQMPVALFAYSSFLRQRQQEENRGSTSEVLRMPDAFLQRPQQITAAAPCCAQFLRWSKPRFVRARP